jgi:hypothetical protein
MNYSYYIQQQYILDIFRHPTLVIFSPKVVKKALLFDIYGKMREQTLNLQLINTKLVKNLINTSKFQFLEPLLTGPIMMAFSTRNSSYKDLITIIQLFEDKLNFTGALLNNNIFITQQRLRIMQNNPYQLFTIIFLIYNLYILTLLSKTK